MVRSRTPSASRDQLRTLIELGVRLRPEVTEEDVLGAVDDPEPGQPFSIPLLLALACDPGLDGEPDPGALPANVGVLDTEFVEDADAYERPVRFLAAVAGQAGRLEDVVSAIDLDAEDGTLSYVIDGRPRTWDVEVAGDWADGMVLSYVLDDLVAGTGTDVAYFYPGQSFGLVVVEAHQREPLQALLDRSGDPH